jgi:hypothetical protein
MSKEKKLQAAFANWDKTNRFWQTSDGECFFTEPRARKHAHRLEDKSVELCRRSAPKESEPANQTKSNKKTK